MAMKQTRILFRCDAGRQLGGGHVMRCLTLAHALAERGASVTFACSAGTFKTVPTLAASSFPAITLDAPLEATEVVATGQRWDAMVIDHYQFEARHEVVFRQAAPVILAIDDLADRSHDCDILVDQTVGREPSDYAALIAPGTDLRLGADYALLRPEFARARPAALAARAQARRVSRIFVSLGMTDICGITARTVEAVLAAGLEVEIAVAVGSRAESLPDLRALAAADPRVVLHLDCNDVCGLMVASDLAIGAGGMTSWERCCLGLPTIMLVLAENQSENAIRLARLGAIEVVPGHDAAGLGAALRRLAGNPAARVAMSAAASAVTDGRGAARIVDALMGKMPASQVNCP